MDPLTHSPTVANSHFKGVRRICGPQSLLGIFNRVWFGPARSDIENQPQRHVRWDTYEHVTPELSGVLIVRKLQLRFLWIDALCIIQDDPADWAREAARMNDVYGLAYLTIAATSAIYSTDGFLKRSQETTFSIPYYKDVRAEPAGLLFLAYMRTGGDTRVLVF